MRILVGWDDEAEADLISMYLGIDDNEVVVTTTKFEPIAVTLSASFGLPEVRKLVLPHPIGGTDEPTLHEWADAAADRLISLFTTGA